MIEKYTPQQWLEDVRSANQRAWEDERRILSMLVTSFSFALLDKLRKSEEKYNHQNGFMKNDWREECIVDLQSHVDKGDPLDVAAYAAFCWLHQWPTTEGDAMDKVTYHLDQIEILTLKISEELNELKEKER